jgi:hypothetical protein
MIIFYFLFFLPRSPPLYLSSSLPKVEDVIWAFGTSGLVDWLDGLDARLVEMTGSRFGSAAWQPHRSNGSPETTPQRGGAPSSSSAAVSSSPRGAARCAVRDAALRTQLALLEVHGYEHESLRCEGMLALAGDLYLLLREPDRVAAVRERALAAARAQGRGGGGSWSAANDAPWSLATLLASPAVQGMRRAFVSVCDLVTGAAGARTDKAKAQGAIEWSECAQRLAKLFVLNTAAGSALSDERYFSGGGGGHHNGGGHGGGPQAYALSASPGPGGIGLAGSGDPRTWIPQTPVRSLGGSGGNANGLGTGSNRSDLADPSYSAPRGGSAQYYHGDALAGSPGGPHNYYSNSHNRMSSVGVQQLRRGVRMCSNLNVPVLGDPARLPAGSMENAFLVWLLARISNWINAKLVQHGTEAPRISLRWAASYPNMLFAIFLYLLFRLFRLITGL